MSKCKQCQPEDWDDYSLESIDNIQRDLDLVVNTMSEEERDQYHSACERAIVLTTEDALDLARRIRGWI